LSFQLTLITLVYENATRLAILELGIDNSELFKPASLASKSFLLNLPGFY